jgi:hypothetical protein
LLSSHNRILVALAISSLSPDPVHRLPPNLTHSRVSGLHVTYRQIGKTDQQESFFEE